jgi:hypothetical protein
VQESHRIAPETPHGTIARPLGAVIRSGIDRGQVVGDERPLSIQPRW